MRTVAILGTGRVATSLARGLTGAGHRVRVGSRDAGSAKAGALAAAVPEATLCDPRSAAEGADAVILAVPASALEEALAPIVDLDGVVVLDATNSLDAAVAGDRDTVAALVTDLLPLAHVAKVFNTVGAEHLEGVTFGGGRAVMPIAGDEAARGVASELAADLGFEVADLGGPEAFALVEDFARVWIRLALVQGWGRLWAFSVLRR